MYLDPISFGLGFVVGILISIVVFLGFVLLPSFNKNTFSIKKEDTNPMTYKTEETITYKEPNRFIQRRESNNSNINLEHIIRKCLEDYLLGCDYESLTERCFTIKDVVRNLTNVIIARFPSYISSNYYMENLTHIYEMSDEEIETAITNYIEKYVSSRTDVQANLLSHIKNKSSKQPHVVNATTNPQEETIDLFKAAGFGFEEEPLERRF